MAASHYTAEPRPCLFHRSLKVLDQLQQHMRLISNDTDLSRPERIAKLDALNMVRQGYWDVSGEPVGEQRKSGGVCDSVCDSV